MKRFSIFVAEIPFKPKKYKRNKVFAFTTTNASFSKDSDNNSIDRYSFDAMNMSDVIGIDGNYGTSNESDLVKKKIFTNFEEFCRKTSAHGIINLFKATNWVIRVIWISLIIAFAGYCTYSKTKLMRKY